MAKREPKYDEHGEIRVMAYADGYLMVRRPGKMPFILHYSEWDDLSDKPTSVIAPIPEEQENGS